MLVLLIFLGISLASIKLDISKYASKTGTIYWNSIFPLYHSQILLRRSVAFIGLMSSFRFWISKKYSLFLGTTLFQKPHILVTLKEIGSFVDFSKLRIIWRSDDIEGVAAGLAALLKLQGTNVVYCITTNGG